MALIADLRHYLGDDLSLIKIPTPAAALREFLICLVEVVTSRDPEDANHVTQVKCWKGCKGDIAAFIDPKDASIIQWSCVSCEECGQITGWKKTIWNKKSNGEK